jgi:hypothetical protein
MRSRPICRHGYGVVDPTLNWYAAQGVDRATLTAALDLIAALLKPNGCPTDSPVPF